MALRDKYEYKRLILIYIITAMLVLVYGIIRPKHVIIWDYMRSQYTGMASHTYDMFR
jgi:hypothetical protein